MIAVVFSLLPAIILVSFGGLLATWIHLVNRPDNKIETLATRISWIALFLYLAWMIILSVYQGQLPFVSIGQLLAFFGFLIWGAHIYVQRKVKQGILVIAPIITVIAMTLMSLIIGTQPVQVPDMFSSVWVSFHITFAVAGAVLVQGAGIHSLGYVILHRQIKQRKFGPLFTLLPSLEDLARLRTVAILTGWLLISFGMIGGIVWMGIRTEFFEILTGHLGIAIIFWIIISITAVANRFRWLSQYQLSGFSVILSAVILILIFVSIIVTYPGGSG
jgi:HemX protein